MSKKEKRQAFITEIKNIIDPYNAKTGNDRFKNK